MVIICMTNCPPALRGDLSKWLNEINTGVYIGKLSARVRDGLWGRICDNIKEGQATMVYSASNAQGYNIRVHNSGWEPEDFDGITLMRRPLTQIRPAVSPDTLKNGFSKAAKYEKAKKYAGNSSKSESSKTEKEIYVILDLETTGLDTASDKILEIGALKVEGTEVVDTFHCLVNTGDTVSKTIVSLTGITDELICDKGMREKEAVEGFQDFAAGAMVIGYNVKFDMAFIMSACSRLGINNQISKTRDVLALARRKIEDVENYKMETVARYFGIEDKIMHRALGDCEIVRRIYIKLNEI